MTANHHPSEAWLMDYALGNVPEAFETILMAHVGSCEVCRANVEAAEQFGGEVVAATRAVSDAVSIPLPEIDAAADSAPVMYEPISRAVDAGTNGGFDFFVRTYLNCSSESLRWRRLSSGLAICRLREEGNVKMWLLKARPGTVLPQHTHQGSELTLVLKGAYFCGEALFKAGDIEDADEATRHQPMVTGTEDCICLAVTEGSLQFKSPIAKLAQKFVGI